MTYRTQGTVEPAPLREEVVEITRFPPAVRRVMLGLALVLTMAAVALMGVTNIECTRRGVEAPSCELVYARVAFTAREHIESVETKEASLGDDGEKEYLTVQTTTEPLHFFSLGGRNKEIAAAYARYQQSSEPNLSLRVERNMVMSGMLLSFAFPCLVPVLMRGRKVVVVDLDTGVVRTGKTTRRTDGFVRVCIECEEGDSDIAKVLLEVGTERLVLGEAPSKDAVVAANRLDAMLRKIWDDKKKATQAITVSPDA